MAETKDPLLDGYRRFRSEVWPQQRGRYERLAEHGQRPATMVIACSDSRADPALIFDAAPGQLFTVRNVAGLVPPYAPDAQFHGTSAALEFAVRVLRVRRIVCLGHARCGGVQAMVEGAPPAAPDFVEKWMEIAAAVRHLDLPRAEGADALCRHEVEVTRLSVANLRTFPWIAEAEVEGRLVLEGMRFDIHTGRLDRITGAGLEPVV